MITPTNFALLSVVLALTLTVSCATTSTPSAGPIVPAPGPVVWPQAVLIGLTVARDTLPAVQALVDANPTTPLATKAEVDRVFRVTDDALALAESAVQDYVAAPGLVRQCALGDAIERALTAALQAVTLANDAGAHIPAVVVSAIGGLGVAADLVPGGLCGDGGTTVSGTARAAMVASRVR